MSISRNREVDIHILLLWMYASQIRDTDTHFFAFLDVRFLKTRSVHPFFSLDGCTLLEIKKLTSLFLPRSVSASQNQEADIHFLLLWMYASQNPENDTHFFAFGDVRFSKSRSVHPFFFLDGCTLLETKKLISLFLPQSVSASQNQEADIHFLLLWMCASQNGETDIHFPVCVDAHFLIR